MFTIPTSQLAAVQPSQTVVIPAYNEEDRIAATVTSVVTFLEAQSFEWEVIVVDDGSTDATASRAREAMLNHDTVHVLTVPHGGKAAAVRTGVDAAVGDLILFADADMATPIAYLLPFRDAIAEGADIAIGSREGNGASRIGEPSFRHAMGRVFNGLVRVSLLPGIQDTQCGFKLFTRESATDIFASTVRHQPEQREINGPRVTAFDVELLLIAKRHGYRVVTLPVTWTFGEQSKVNPIADTITNASDLVAIKWNDLRGRYD